MKVQYRLTVIFILIFFSRGLLAGNFSEGVQYERITPPVPTSTSGKTVEVVELFWYGCPHCFHFEPMLKKWLKKKPANVKFVRVPATFNPIWKLHARMYYTVEVLGMTDKLHQKIFDAYHVDRKRLRNEKEIRDLFVKHGVKGSDFDDTFHSFAVETRLNRAIDLTQSYGIRGVPAMVVNGKYRTSNKISGHQSQLDVVDFLVRKESR